MNNSRRDELRCSEHILVLNCTKRDWERDGLVSSRSSSGSGCRGTTFSTFEHDAMMTNPSQ